MAEYTADDLKQALRKDAVHGDKYAFVLKKMDTLGHRFKVEWLIGRDFSGDSAGVTVSTGAGNLAEAVGWAKDGLREWAHDGMDKNGNYFGLTVREWAISKGASTAVSCGSTVDFAFVFSGASSKSAGVSMYALTSVIEKDLFDLVCWAFANMWSVRNPLGASQLAAKVNIQGKEGGGPPGLHRHYWDSRPDSSHTDQTHHFAFYFAVGAKVGAGLELLKPFLIVTGDWGTGGRILNAGDYYLGLTAARLGASFRQAPGLKGSAIATALLSPYPDYPIRPDPTPPVPPFPPVPVPPAPVPFIPRSGRAKTTGTELRVRTGPGLNHPTVRFILNKNTPIVVLTQVPGDSVDGNFLWDKLADGYVADRYVKFDS